MKSFTTLLFAISILAKTSNSQGIDSYNVFKELKPGMSKVSLQGQLNLNDDGTYQYIGSCCKTIFKSIAKYILLRFDKSDKVSSIIVRTNDRFFTIPQIMEFKNRVDSELGVAGTESKEGTVKKIKWRGNIIEITLTIFILELSPNSTEPIYSSEFEISKL